MSSNQKRPSFYSKLLTGDVRSGWTLVVGVVLSFFMLVGAFDTAMPLLALVTNGSLVAAPGGMGQGTQRKNCGGGPCPMTEAEFLRNLPPAYDPYANLAPKIRYMRLRDGTIYPQKYNERTGQWEPCTDCTDPAGRPIYPRMQDSSPFGEGQMYGLAQSQCVSALCVASSFASSPPYYYVPFNGIRGGEYANGNFAGIVLPINTSGPSGSPSSDAATNIINAVYVPGAPAPAPTATTDDVDPVTGKKKQ